MNLNLTKTEARVLSYLNTVEKARFTDVKEAADIPDKTVFKVLQRLMKKELVKKVDKFYCKTNKVEEVLQSSAARTYALEEAARKAIDITYFITKRRARLEDVAFLKEKKPRERLRLGIPRLFLGYRLGSKVAKLNSEQRKLVDELAKTFKKCTRVAVYPPLETSEEAKRIADAQLRLVSKFLKEKRLREKVAKERKLTIMFTLDLSNSKLSEKEVRNAIYLMFV